MSSFWSIIQDIRKQAYTEHDKGTRFERLICNYLKTSKKYQILLKEVWLWNEFPYRKEFGGSDIGIDLVALTKDGHYWAIQCKCYADDTVINKAAVDSFLSTSSRQFVDDNFEQQSFSSRLWFATNNKWGKNAKEAFENQKPPAYIINSWDKVEDDKQQMLFDDFIPEEHDFTFDYIVCDEAHRTTGAIIGGKDESAFTKVHNNSNVAGKHRLYMTATPRLYADNAKKKAEENSVVLCSMDDKNLYGEEIYRIGFGEAVEKDLLSDYKVLILTVRENTQLPADLLQAVQDKNQEINADDAVKLVGVINALSKRVVPDPDIVKSVDPALMHRAVAFCSKISVSKVTANSFTNFGKSIQENFQEDAQEDTVIATAKHIDGSMNANERNELVSWLRNAPTDSNECRILTNVRCLSEGVDVPSLDAVIFLSKRNSQVDVVQSVGRVMRKAEGKKYGYIIIPVIIPDEGDPNTILDNNDNYAVI